MIYDQDSLFTLTPAQQAGVLVVSVVLALLCLALVRRGRGRGMRLVLAGAAFWAFVWLSPQAYYAYYQVALGGLPAQIVIKAPPGPTDLARLLAFAGPATFSAHGKGALGWALIALSLWRPRPRGSL